MLAAKHSASVASWGWTSPPQPDPFGSWETFSLELITLSSTMAMSVWALQRQLSSPTLLQVGLKLETVAAKHNNALVLILDQGC